jgi:hypothetical protein
MAELLLHMCVLLCSARAAPAMLLHQSYLSIVNWGRYITSIYMVIQTPTLLPHQLVPVCGFDMICAKSYCAAASCGALGCLRVHSGISISNASVCLRTGYCICMFSRVFCMVWLRLTLCRNSDGWHLLWLARHITRPTATAA